MKSRTPTWRLKEHINKPSGWRTYCGVPGRKAWDLNRASELQGRPEGCIKCIKAALKEPVI